MRHSAAGLAIPDFPASFGGILPDHWNSKIAIHFAHRAWALAAAAAVFAAARIVLKSGNAAGRGARRSVFLLAMLLPVQVFLGALSVWTRKAVPVTVAHQTLGAVLLACAAATAIFVLREEFLRGRLAGVEPALAAGGAR
jgi:heme A synthase